MAFWICFTIVAAVLMTICVRHLRQQPPHLDRDDTEHILLDDDEEDEDDGARKLHH